MYVSKNDLIIDPEGRLGYIKKRGILNYTYITMAGEKKTVSKLKVRKFEPTKEVAEIIDGIAHYVI